MRKSKQQQPEFTQLSDTDWWLSTAQAMFYFYFTEIRPKRFLFVYAHLDLISEDLGYPCFDEELYQTTIYLADPREAASIAAAMRQLILLGVSVAHPVNLVHQYGGSYRGRVCGVPIVNTNKPH